MKKTNSFSFTNKSAALTLALGATLLMSSVSAAQPVVLFDRGQDTAESEAAWPEPGPRKPADGPQSLKQVQITQEEQAEGLQGGGVALPQRPEVKPVRVGLEEPGADILADAVDLDDRGEPVATVDEDPDLARVRAAVAEALSQGDSGKAEEEQGIPERIVHAFGDDAVEMARQAADEEEMEPPYIAPFILKDWRQVDFVQTRERLAQEFGAGLLDGLEDSRSGLDLAQLYLSHAMAHEAASLIDALDGALLDAEQAAEARALKEAATLLRGATSLDDLRIITSPEFEDWADWAPWTMFALASKGRWEEAAEAGEEALARILQYPEPLQGRFLTALARAQIESGQPHLGKARETLLALEDTGREKEALSFLMGRAAAALGRNREAFEAYWAASQGAGRFAQEARIAIVDLGVASGRMSASEAAQLLEEARYLWRGDRLESEALKRLAVVYLESDNEVAALLTLGDLYRRFSDTRDGELALKNARSLLEAVYTRGLAGEIDLGRWIETHESLRQSFGTFKGFADYSEAFAEQMVRIGLTSAAAREYALLAEEAPAKEEPGYRVREAGALVDGGNFERAADVLAGLEDPLADPQAETTRKTLWARVVAEIGEPARVEEFLEAKSEAAEALLLRGEGAWTAEDWPKARSIYNKLRQQHPDVFSSIEALRLLLSAYRTGEAKLFRDVAHAHPELIGSTEWQTIAADLVAERPIIAPVGGQEARSLLDEADAARGLVSRAFEIESGLEPDSDQDL